jgi:hypothetical protein
LNDVETNLETLREKLLDRHFPTTLISEKFDKAKRLDRKDILRRKPRKQKSDKVRGIFTHNQGNPPLHQWIRESKKLLIKNEKAKQIGERIQIGWRQPKNLKRMVCGLKGAEKKLLLLKILGVGSVADVECLVQF